jgi:hypothetical protein
MNIKLPNIPDWICWGLLHALAAILGWMIGGTLT